MACFTVLSQHMPGTIRMSGNVIRFRTKYIPSTSVERYDHTNPSGTCNV